MIKFINSWAQGIIIAVIISTIIEMILPEGNIKKYIKTVIGAYIVFVIVSPIVTKITGKELDLKQFELPDAETYEVATIDTNAYIETTYISKIEEEIKNDIEENGYNVKSISIQIEKSEENYGNINKINLGLKKQEKSSRIEPVEIDVKEKETENDISEEEIEKLKKILNETYGTDIKNIIIE